MFSSPFSVRLFGIIVLALFIGSCASYVGHHKVEDLYDVALSSSPARTYQATFEEVKKAALYAIQQTGMENIAEHPGELVHNTPSNRHLSYRDP